MSDTSTTMEKASYQSLGDLDFTGLMAFGEVLVLADIFTNAYQLQGYYGNPSGYQNAYEFWQGHGAPTGPAQEGWILFTNYLASFNTVQAGTSS